MASQSYSRTSSNQTTTTQDNSLTTGKGDIVGNITSSANAPITITTANAELAQSAIESVKGLAEGSNQIAAQVADSQKSFVESASGQKTFLWGAAILVAAGLLFRGGKTA